MPCPCFLNEIPAPWMNDGDGYENVNYKVNARCFKLYGTYSISFSSKNVAKIFRSWIFKDCIKVQEEKENCYLVFTFFTKHEITKFHTVVVQWRQRNVKKRDARAKSLYERFANPTPHSFVTLISTTKLGLGLPNKVMSTCVLSKLERDET